MIEIQNYIDGRLVPAQAGRVLEVFEPAVGKAYAHAPDSAAEDIEAAVTAAEAAFPVWSAQNAEYRSRFLRRISALIERDLEALAHAESVDSGKPLALARRMDIPRAAQNFAFFADAITQTSGEAYASDPATLNYTLRDPLGVVGCISPWNLPLYLFSWKIAPALAAGCTVVAKPSEVTPMTAYLLAKLCLEADLPPGVLNIVHGRGEGAGLPLVRSPRVRAISFTGSTRTGTAIATETAASFKKLSLEMGGKNACLVFADCDFERAVEQAVRAAFTNQGQICLCGSRILVERSIYEPFKKAFVERARALKLGDPLTEGTEQGAVVSREHFDKVMGCLETARQEGGLVLTGGGTARVEGRCENGWFIEPTVIEGLPADCSTNQEEIFGPVATLMPFDTETEALQAANGTRYGLSAVVWTRDLSRAHRVSARLQAGVIWVNCWLVRDLRTPFGGMKESGVGREGGRDALHFFTEQKNICVRIEGETS